MIPWLAPSDPPDAFPPVSEALREPDGLLCAGGDLSVPRLLAAYRRGVFPWFSQGQPILWWCPDPRAVLFPREFKVSRSLAKTLRNRGFETTFDRSFAAVMRLCADSDLRPEGTWITPQMLAAYQDLHAAGYAHSVETWLDGRLVGGLYGIALGRVFFGESMFSLERDASKVALKALVDAAVARDAQLIDCQVSSSHLASLGARDIPRSDFVTLLDELIPDLRPTVAWTQR
ncbi:MAG: leucyl/phenylalanyl-tRNA--protein transferase [Gammaproteobacteria bacterium]|nr:leucyl/phenylalanyl-tRNA--protein transferase [Gammaproteobacteria bacterium]